MGVLVIDWQTYYEAARKCHDLAADLRVADKPVHDAVKGECVGMAGDTAGCEAWAAAYDRATLGTLQTCTNLADALTNLGNMLYAAGYNWALSNKSNPMPDVPSASAMTEHKVTIPSSKGSDGDGVIEGQGSIPGFYDALVGEVQKEFGSKLPNGNKQKLAAAAAVWRTFADHPSVSGAAARIAEISSLFDDIRDKDGGLQGLLGHLTTLHGGATQLASASVNIAAPVGDYSTATAEVRDAFKSAVTNALIAAGTTVVIGVAASWITAALSNVAAGVGVVAIAGNTARVLKSAYDASKLYRIIGAAAATAGATTFAITAFDGVPDLTQVAAELAAIVAMKVYLNADDTEDINSGNPSGAFTSASMTTKVNKIANHYGVPAQEVRDAIHKIKAQGAWRGDGANRNPDVVVDLDSGEVYVKLPGGEVSEDSIGNILDELED
ncbi:hypothetical protein [Nocardia farcinica]|nr:hypothetical protein [Nocardia farcinica]